MLCTCADLLHTETIPENATRNDLASCATTVIGFIIKRECYTGTADFKNVPNILR